MSSFAGNMSYKISVTLQFRAFSIPWVNGNKGILCLKDREYSSSVPVRYIPKKPLETEEPEISSHLKGLRKNESHKYSASNAFGRKFTNNSSIVDKKLQTRNGMFKKNALYDDVKQDHEVTQNPVDVVEEMPQGQGNSGKNSLQVCKGILDAEKSAIELLAARAYTAVELRKKLLAKRFPPDIVETVIRDFHNRGFINDSLYAEAFSRSRWSSSTWGPRRIKQALFKKGISEADAETALKLVFEGQVDDSNDDQETRIGLSKLSMDHLLVQASKQWFRGHDVPKETRKSRIVRWLQYRGFNWGVIGFIVKKLESRYPP
ncbi:Leucine-rich receptor-like protein kinase family protein isoform 1 [Hibiscus syriacus]|uniref:Regulatory protein RecX n=2 Tax=Hibiscus syriacus TaxID=106335 RepID=A0A6A3BCH5_HIBSY|nr:Leucine-rich receptor-like protein kinase family protein isoform 1 [Hibiscus syriacus]